MGRSTYLALILVFLCPGGIFAENAPEQEAKTETVYLDADQTLDDRAFLIEDINDTLTFNPEMMEDMEGMRLVENESGRHIELNGVPVDKLEQEQLREIWLKVNQKTQNEQMEMIRMINQQQRQIKEVQDIQRTVNQVRSASQTPKLPTKSPR